MQRTLDIQGAAKQSNDVAVVNTINTFGKRAARLGDTLLMVLESYQATLGLLDESLKGAVLEHLQEKTREQMLRSYLGRRGGGIWVRMEDWAAILISGRMPLQVNAVKLYLMRCR